MVSSVFRGWEEVVYIRKEKRAAMLSAVRILQNGRILRCIGKWQAAAQYGAANRASVAYAISHWRSVRQAAVLNHWSVWAMDSAVNRDKALGASSLTLLGSMKSGEARLLTSPTYKLHM